jgi:hypothetical protein
VIVLAIVPPTTLVNAEKVVLVAPAGTVTLAGMVSGSLPVSVTTAPPVGAGADNATLTRTASPPTTVELTTVIDASVARAVTVSAGDWLLLPFIDAVMEAVPGATATTMKPMVVEPAGTVAVAGTEATAALLLASEMVEPPAGAAALNVMVPVPLPPTVTLVALSETAEIAVVGVGDVDDEPPHWAVPRRATTAAASLMSGGVWRIMYLMPDELSTSVPRARHWNSAAKAALQQCAVGSVRSGIGIQLPIVAIPRVIVFRSAA